jgi:cytoskeletal protein CcmA (bactofilin family)
MVDYQVPEDAFINSIIGEGTRLSGEFELNGLLRIDGDFCGTVRTKGKVLVGRNGRAECTVHAGTVVIGGIVRGNIFASERVVILSTGIVLGNIQAPRFIVEEGVVLHGTCKVEHSSQAEEQARTSEPGDAKKPSAQTPRPEAGMPTPRPEAGAKTPLAPLGTQTPRPEVGPQTAAGVHTPPPPGGQPAVPTGRR